MNWLKVNSSKYPLLRDLVGIQILFLVVGLGLFFFLLQWISQIQMEYQTTRLKDETRSALSLEQEELRAWQMLGLYSAVEEKFAELSQNLSLTKVEMILRSNLPLVDFNQIIIPETDDGLSDWVILAEINTLALEKEFQLGSYTFYFLLGAIFLFLGLILFSVYYIRRFIYQPISQLNQAFSHLQNDGTLQTDNIKASGEIDEFIKAFTDMYQQSKNYQKQMILMDAYGQIAHDIRSPLSALQMLEGRLEELPENKRLLLRSAIARVKEITQSLTEKQNTISKEQNPKEPSKIEGPVHLASIVDSIASEKRIQYESHHIDIDFQITGESYSLFAQCQTTELKRILSNLIDNAVESILSGPKHQGLVEIQLLRASAFHRLLIRDNGVGVKEADLDRVFEKGVTLGKKGGSGLGLYHAKSCIHKWGGTIRLVPQEQGGTMVDMRLPVAQVPSWFATSLPSPQGQPGGTVYVLDDDKSIHQVWETRWKENFPDLKLQHAFSSKELCTLLKASPTKSHHLYLIDFDLGSSALDNESGLKVIEQLKLQPHAYLVTSRYEDPQIQKLCLKQNIQLVPKTLATYIPLQASPQVVSLMQ